MNMKIENTPRVEGETDYSRAYAINNQVVMVVNAAIASGSVQPSQLADLIRSVHKAFAETYGVLDGAEQMIEKLSTSTSEIAISQASEDFVEVEAQVDAAAEADVVVVETLEEVVASAPKPVSLYADPMDAVTDEKIYCLIDGIGRKMIKRHLRTQHGLEWEEYLELFNLPADYPSVAKNYSKEKAVEAKKLGLGSTVPKTPKAVREAAAAAAEASTPRNVARGRRRTRDGVTSHRIATAKVAA